MNIIKIVAILLLHTGLVQAQKLSVTDAGSKVNFTIKNFGIKTNGNFTGLKGNIIFNAMALSTSSFNVTVNTASINTNNTARDKHLRKEEYFYADKYPTITFTSTKITNSTVVGRYYVYGNLTIKGITKAVEFGFSATPTANGYLFSGELEINRRNFGVGGSSVSMADNLKVMLSVLSIK